MFPAIWESSLTRFFTIGRARFRLRAGTSQAPAASPAASTVALSAALIALDPAGRRVAAASSGLNHRNIRVLS